MSKAVTHFCDYCGKEVWGEDLRFYDRKEFCSDECIEEYAQEEAGFR